MKLVTVDRVAGRPAGLTIFLSYFIRRLQSTYRKNYSIIGGI